MTRHSARSAPSTMAGIPEPVTLPVATRAWCVRDPRNASPNSTAPEPRRWKPPPRPKKFIAFDTECATSSTASMPGFEGERWAPAGQALLFGCAVIGRTSDWRIERELIFYPDDLPEIGVAAASSIHCGADLYMRGSSAEGRRGSSPIGSGATKPGWGHRSTDAASRSSFCRSPNSSSSSIASPTKIVHSSSATIFPSPSRASRFGLARGKKG